MTQRTDILLTALAPLIWGSSYVVSTELLPDVDPLWVAALRALPAGLLMLLLVRRLPKGIWWARMLLLGALNFTIFWALLFIAAYRLPGGVAATLGATQPLMVIFLAQMVLGSRIQPLSVVAAIMGFGGVALLVLTPGAAWDMVGVGSAGISAVSMALGTVLTRRWQPDASALTVTAWQLSAGGVLLLPVALVFTPDLPVIDMPALLGLVHLSLLGAAFAYVLWFRGVARMTPEGVSSLAFLSPLTAVLLGWVLLGQSLEGQALAGVALTLISVWLSQNTGRVAGLFSRPATKLL